MDIKIKNTINISLDVLELDEHIPSIKFSILIEKNNFGFSLSLNSQAWIECERFDQFISDMQQGKIAILQDINEMFQLTLDPCTKSLKWRCAKEDLNGFTVNSCGEEMLTDELSLSVYEAFYNYPKWWS